ncbi:MAG TPA: Ig-like domain-containing protein [Clostridia bacterium]|nr:Ig-like domain-containing protein [Clostridia bacterium]
MTDLSIWGKYQFDSKNAGKTSQINSLSGLAVFENNISDIIFCVPCVFKKESGTYKTWENGQIVEKTLYTDAVIVAGASKIYCYDAMTGLSSWTHTYDLTHPSYPDYTPELLAPDSPLDVFHDETNALFVVTLFIKYTKTGEDDLYYITYYSVDEDGNKSGVTRIAVALNSQGDGLTYESISFGGRSRIGASGTSKLLAVSTKYHNPQSDNLELRLRFSSTAATSVIYASPYDLCVGPPWGGVLVIGGRIYKYVLTDKAETTTYATKNIELVDNYLSKYVCSVPRDTEYTAVTYNEGYSDFTIPDDQLANLLSWFDTFFVDYSAAVSAYIDAVKEKGEEFVYPSPGTVDYENTITDLQDAVNDFIDSWEAPASLAKNLRLCKDTSADSFQGAYDFTDDSNISGTPAATDNLIILVGGKNFEDSDSPLGIAAYNSSLIFQWGFGSGTLDFTGNSPATYKDSDTEEEAVFVASLTDDKLYRVNTDGTQNFSVALPGTPTDGLAIYEYESLLTGKVPIIIGVTDDGYLWSKEGISGIGLGALYNWNTDTGKSGLKTPQLDNDNNIYIPYDSGVLCYSYVGTLLFDYSASGSSVSPGAFGRYYAYYTSRGTSTSYLIGLGSTSVNNFAVQETDPADDDTGVSATTDLEITFTSPPKQDTLIPANITIQYESEDGSTQSVEWTNYVLSNGDKTVTITLDSSLPSNTEITVIVTDSITAVNGTALAEDYVFQFTTGDVVFIADYFSGLTVDSPSETYSEWTKIIFNAPVVSYPEAKWYLHFKVVVTDSLSAVISTLSSEDNPEEFEYSTDGELTWTVMDAGGLAPANYEAKIRATVKTGRVSPATITVSVGAEDA